MNPSAELGVFSFEINHLDGEHLEGVAALEASAYSPPWSLADFRRELHRPESVTRVAIVSAPVPAIVGYLVAWRILDEVHIQKVTTHPAHRRRGIGRALVSDVLAASAAQGARRALLEVRVSNRAARALYCQAGFSEDGRRRRYYADGEDAVLMSALLRPPGEGA